MNLSDKKIAEYTERLHIIFNSLFRYKKPFEDLEKIPKNGLCITFENGEKCFDNKYDRIVHIGFHYSENNNRNRIGQFFLTKGRDATLKRHIGVCIIKEANENKRFLELWGKHPSNKTDKDDEYFKLEKKYNEIVHQYIYENMSFAVLPYLNSNRAERKFLKDKILYTLAMYNKNQNLDLWLGNKSVNQTIAQYGLWNEDYLAKGKFLTDEDIDLLEKLLINE